MNDLENETCFFQEEYQQEINHQLELVSSLNLDNLTNLSLSQNDMDSRSLLMLSQSLFKSTNNKFFLQNFKTNQVNI
jgi:hypothetical protein